MIIKHNEGLAKYTTFKMGGIATNFYVPESRIELVQLLKSLNEYNIIGGGSNLLINDKAVFTNVIHLVKFDDNITSLGDGKYYVGASVRLQKLINTVNNDGFGGIEYLFSVPGLIGGAIVMNAGRGRQFNQQISDYIVSVDAIYNGEIVTLSKEECLFQYRNSIFKHSDYLIIGVLFKFSEMKIEESKRLKNERIKLCREKQDSSGFNFGSVFCKYNPTIMKVAPLLRVEFNSNVRFSKKTQNWICNSGKGTYKQTLKLIKLLELMHKMSLKKIEREVIVWE
ncbi:FAD-binding protein [uncultured Clostridium sp.]|uniref:FAD-binding protein n=1 Tax=uncultured Clostridium sp. TaxID=59620 RepID=UPI0025E956AC|nr:FAD-binding protein [uncultured Clostridium sp.]